MWKYITYLARKKAHQCLFLLLFFAPLNMHAASNEKTQPEKGYTINFDNVPIQEFLRFVSRIGKINVIYNENELDFNVTIVSEEETNLQNVMSALVQVLRINGYTLIEEDQNLLIHKNDDVKQIPTVIGSAKKITSEMRPTIMTKVFKIEKGNPSHIAALLTPMLSREAMVEVSMETRQLIITDIASSLTTIQDLLANLDVPETPYDVESYHVQNLSVAELALLAKRILAPITENTALELVPQEDSQTIYIVSTPFMIQRTLKVLNEIDKESIGSSAAARGSFNGDNVFIYRLRQHSMKEVEDFLKRIAEEAGRQGFKSSSLLSTINNAKYVDVTRSVMFIGPPNDLKVIQSFLTSIEASGSEGSGASFFLYESPNMASKELRVVVSEITDHLKKSGHTHPSVVVALESAQLIEPIDSFLFTGNPESLAEVKSLLAEVESSYEEDIHKTTGSRFFIYNIKRANEEQIRRALHHLADYLETNKLDNQPLVTAIDSMRWVKSTNSLMFTGNSRALVELSDLLPSFDVPPSSSMSTLHQIPPSTEFVIYSPKHVSANDLKKAIDSTTENLKSADLSDPALLKTLESVRILSSSNQLIFTGDGESLKKLGAVLSELDQSGTLESMREGPYFIQLHHTNYSHIRNALEKMAQDLHKDDPIRKMIRSMHYLSDSHTIVLRGTPEALKRVNAVIELTDNETAALSSGSRVEFVHLEHRPVKGILSMLHETAAKLKRGDSPSEELVKTLENAQAVSGSNTIILSGSEADLTKIKQLIATDDQPFKDTSNTEVYIYKLKYLTPKELQSSLSGVAEHAHSKDPSDSTSSLVSMIETMRVIPNSDAVQFIGPPKVVEKLKEIISVIDSPEHTTSKVKTRLGSNFLVYNVKHLNPTELLTHLREIIKDSPLAKQDAKLNEALASGRYAKESNALVFTGDKESLDKIHLLLERLDVGDMPSASSRTAEGYKIYHPQFVPGPQLVQMVKNFEHHLVASGVTDHSLAEVIEHLSYIPRTNTIIVTGPLQEMSRVIDLLKEFDTQSAALGEGGESDLETIDDTGFLLYKLQHQNGEGLVSALQQISQDLGQQDSTKKKNQPLIDAIKSVQFIQITNTLMATGQPKVLTKLRELLESMDRPMKQVFIEILVLETSMSRELDFGLRWGSQGSSENRLAWGTGNYNIGDSGEGFAKNFGNITGTRVPTGADIPPIPGGFLGVIGDIVWHKGKSYASLGSMVNALKTDGDTTIVLSQKIICQDSQNAKIFSGDNIPFTGSLVTTSGLTQTTNANLEYRNVGVTVSLTPIIGNKGIITLDIDHEISEESNQGSDDGSSDVSVRTVNGIRTSRTTMTTRVNMPNKHFLVLSGTMRNQVVRSVAGVPCLGGLPLVGAAFSQTRREIEKRNVIMFIKPHIIDSDQHYSEITDQQEEIFGGHDQANVQDFYDGLELIRSPDDEDYNDE